ncbi:MAG: hypothetical protein HFI34_11300 [Lachnospiraceae bacterium]|nr:hypothetical protein [Lachnospiraceae bacterium]
MNLKHNIEKVLHTPYNYKGGRLEFAIVFDYHVPEELLSARARELIALLRTIRYSRSKNGTMIYEDIFRNARLNIIKWISDDRIIKEVSSMGMVQMGKCFEDYDVYKEEGRADKSLDILTGQLKMFYARSKIIFLITDGSYIIKSREETDKNLQPFLKHKLVYINI